jgi:hypothetical protein
LTTWAQKTVKSSHAISKSVDNGEIGAKVQAVGQDRIEELITAAQESKNRLLLLWAKIRSSLGVYRSIQFPRIPSCNEFGNRRGAD